MYRTLLLILAGGLALLTSAPRASARSETALAGYIRPADRGCFQESWGTMLNTCTTTRQIFIPAAIDKHCVSGRTWQVTAQSNNSSQNVCCRVIGMFDDGRISAGSLICLSSFGAAQRFNVNGPPVWVDRAFYVCDVGANARVFGIDWSPVGDC